MGHTTPWIAVTLLLPLVTGAAANEISLGATVNGDRYEVSTRDLNDASPPQDVRASKQADGIWLAWDAPKHDAPLLGFRVERDGRIIAEVPPSATAYHDPGGQPVFGYAVSAITNHGPGYPAVIVTAVPDDLGNVVQLVVGQANRVYRPDVIRPDDEQDIPPCDVVRVNQQAEFPYLVVAPDTHCAVPQV